MADLHVDFLGKRLAGPVIAASGTFGFGPEYAGIEDLRVLGGISGKGLTLNGQPGNEGERLYETPSGLMNSIGLQNPGVQHFIDHELPAMRQCGTTVWANLGGHTIEENIEGVAMLCAAGVDFIELNISCPNVKQGGLAFGIRAAMFCYAVYCQETGHPFGHAPIESDAPEFAGFVPTKKQLEYILHIPEFGWSKLNKRTATYQSAWHYLVARNFF